MSSTLDKKVAIVLLTAGEVPSESNLIYSQVIRCGLFLSNVSRYSDIMYVAMIPVSAVLASYLHRRPVKFGWIAKLPFASITLLSIVNIDFQLIYMAKRFLLGHDAKRLSRRLKLKKDATTVFHCRSYVATHLAIEVKRQNPQADIRVLFDMRSILTAEFVFMMRGGGRLFYASGKEWERWLLKRSDLSLLSTERGIAMLRLENPDAKIHKINIMGMETGNLSPIEDCFEDRWRRKNVRYVGSIGQWNPESLVTSVLLHVKSIFQDCNIGVISGNYRRNEISHISVPHNQMLECYERMLCSVIPGMIAGTYFESLKMSTNFFSTKASEALSCGVPLIVNVAIEEVAEIVRKSSCGVLFRVGGRGEVEFDEGIEEKLGKKEFWHTLTLNAKKIGEEYSFQRTMVDYQRYYEMILSQQLGK